MCAEYPYADTNTHPYPCQYVVAFDHENTAAYGSGMGIKDILADMMEMAGDNAYSLSDKSGVPQPTINRILTGTHGDPRSKTVKALAKAYGVTESQLRGESAQPSVEKRAISVAGNAISVQVFDAEASMGTGKAQPENDTVVGSIQLNPAWVKQRLPSISSPANLAVLTAYGDSMEPTFSDGDMLLVDRGVLEVRLDAVYVLAFNHELFIKRIQRRMNGDVVIKSDNPLYDPHVVENGERELLQVLGRVVWAWNGRKL